MSNLVHRVSAALAGAPLAGLHAGDLDDLPIDGAHEAAVLVAITERVEPGVLLTVRRADLRSHGGQISFPGGRVDPDDRDLAHTALRESWEEIGLDPASVTLCGAADPYRTITNYRVTPIVGVIPPDPALQAHPDEVSDWFEAPLAFLLDPANQHCRHADIRGRARSFYEIIWRDYRIWGATAAMIVNLSRRLQWS